MRRNRAKRRNSNRYQSLEPRRLLSADLDAARNIVVGGDFETGSEFVSFLDGDEADTNAIRVRELSTTRSRVAQLDNVPGRMESIAQDIDTEPGKTYIISFDLRGSESAVGENSNSVDVFFGGQQVGTYHGINKWQTINVSATAGSELSRLEFRETTSTTSDGVGILLDHVSVAGAREIAVENHSLEVVDGDFSDNVVPASAVLGFFSINEGGSPQVGIESTNDATDGNNVLSLNSSDAIVDRVFQNIRTEAWARYFVSFDLRNGDSTDTDPVNVRVRWNDGFSDSFFGTEEWQRFGVVVQANSGFSTLMFREAGGAGSGTDAQIDNIKIYKIDSLTSDFSLDLNGDDDGNNNERPYIENSRRLLNPGNLSLSFSNGNFLSSATVRVLGFNGTESLTATTTDTNIDARFNSSTGILRLVGRDQVSTYQQVLRSIRFEDTNDDPGQVSRQIVVSVTDGSASSERPRTILNVVPINDAPRVTEIPSFPLPQNNPLTINVGAIDPDNEDLNFQISVAGDADVFEEPPTISSEGQIELTAVRMGNARIFVNVRDPEGLGQVFSFDVEVPFEEPTAEIPADFVPFSGLQQLSNTLPSLRNGIYDSAPEQTIDLSLDYQAVIQTDAGAIRFDLFENASPITVNNFVNLAQDGFYDGLNFHRVIDGFVAQGGDPTGVGSGGPGYQFVDELDNGLSFEGFGQLAMANSGPNTNGSQFFFTLNENPVFAGQHTIFGQVIEGADILRAVRFTTGSATPTVIQSVRIEVL